MLATDTEPRFLHALPFNNLEVRRHDIRMEGLPQREFDLAHARLVLMHIPGRELALDRMIAAPKPGFFGTPAGDVRFSEAHLPTWIDGGKRPFCGVPGNHWRGFKIADDTRGAVIDPSTMEREISKEKLSAAHEYLRMRFPAMADAPCWKVAFANMKTRLITTSFWIATRKRRTSGSSAEGQVMASNMGQ